MDDQSMEEGDEWLSDVHSAFKSNVSSEEKGYHETRLCIRLIGPCDEASKASVSLESSSKTDSYGDSELSRRAPTTTTIMISHALETTLHNAGLQLWMASLLLADYIVFHRELFEGKVITEFGAGIGLVSIFAARFGNAKRVVCTDVGNDVLRCCQLNIERNLEDPSRVAVRHFDLMDADLGAPRDTDPVFHQSEDDSQTIRSSDIYLVADLVYSDELTDELLQTLIRLMKNGNKQAFLSVEKRVNFILEEMDVAAPAHQHFVTSLEDLHSYLDDETGTQFSAERLSTTFPTVFECERTSYLELWRITSSY